MNTQFLLVWIYYFEKPLLTWEGIGFESMACIQGFILFDINSMKMNHI